MQHLAKDWNMDSEIKCTVLIVHLRMNFGFNKIFTNTSLFRKLLMNPLDKIMLIFLNQFVKNELKLWLKFNCLNMVYWATPIVLLTSKTLHKHMHFSEFPKSVTDSPKKVVSFLSKCTQSPLPTSVYPCISK